MGIYFLQFPNLGGSGKCSARTFYQQERRVGAKRGKCLWDEHVSVYFGSKMLSSAGFVSKISQHPALEGSSLCRLRGQLFTFTAHWQRAAGLGSHQGSVSFLGRCKAIHHFHESTKHPQTFPNTTSCVLKMRIPGVGSGAVPPFWAFPSESWRQNSDKAWEERFHVLS